MQTVTHTETPQTGQVIIFSEVPTGSYCKPGVAYRVTAPRAPKGDFSFRRVEGDGGTYDRAWAVKRAKWAAA